MQIQNAAPSVGSSPAQSSSASSPRLRGQPRFMPPYLTKHHKGWLAGLPAHVSLDMPSVIPTFLAIGGGKGGVGKSILSANLAGRLAQLGWKVLLADLDIGGANLHTHFGLGLPQKSLVDFTLLGQASFTDILLKTPVEGLFLAAGGRDESWAEASDFSTGAFLSLWEALLYSKERYGFDFVILDLGAGTQKYTIDFYTAAHIGLVTVLPEPTSIENAYSFLKATLWRIVENAGMQMSSCAVADLIVDALFSPSQPGSLLHKLQNLSEDYRGVVDHIFEALQGRTVGFVVNQVRSQKDIEIGTSMETICRQYFGFETKSFGHMNYDDAAWKSLRNRRLLLLDFPHSMISKRVNEVARRILQILGCPEGVACL